MSQRWSGILPANCAVRRKIVGGAAYGAWPQTAAMSNSCNNSTIYCIAKRKNNLEKKQKFKRLLWKGSSTPSCFPLSFWQKIMSGLVLLVFFFIPKKSHLILPFGKGKNMSQWGLVLHTHDTCIPFSIHNQRIIYRAIIINLFQILPIIGNGMRKRVF